MFSPIHLVSASRTDGGGKEIIVVIQERSDGESKPGAWPHGCYEVVWKEDRRVLLKNSA